MADPIPPRSPGHLRVAVTLEQCWHAVPGGTASAALGSVRALQRHGDPEGRATLDLVGVAARHAAEPPAPWTPPLSVRHLPLPRRVLYETWHRLRWPAVERATGSVDVIHVTGMAMPPASAPLVVTVNDLVFLHDPSLFTRHGVAFFERAIELTKRDASIVVCPSQATLDDCLAHGFVAERLRLVPYGIDVEPATDADVARVRHRHGIDGRYVLWLGTIEPRKNVPRLLDAFARALPDATLVLAGGAGWNEDLEPWAEKLGDRVRRIGFVDEADKPGLFAGADLFCLPSLWEGFGIPVLEAMAQGTPVITSRGTSTEELVTDGPDDTDPAGVVVEPRDTDALAAALADLLADDERRRTLGDAARRRANQFSWERTAGGLVSAYLDAAS